MSEPIKQEDNKEGPPPEPTSQQPPPQTDELIPEQEQIGEGDQAKPKEETKQAEKDEELSEDVKDEYSERLDSNRHRNLDYDDKRDRIAGRRRDREDFEDDDSDDLNRDLDKNDKAKRNNARSDDGLGKTAEETKQIAKDRTQDKEVMQEAQRILQRQNEALQEVDMVTIVRTRNVIFLFILIICILTVIFMEIICFALEACFHTNDAKINSVLGIFIFIESIVSLCLQYVTYEASYYGWKRFLKCWIAVIVIGGAILIAAGVIFIIVAIAQSSSNFDATWSSLSSSTQKYFDNSQSTMKRTYQIYTIVASIFCIIEGVMYIIQFICLAILIAKLPQKFKPAIKGSLPPPHYHGIDQLEEQPKIDIIAKKKSKKSKAKKKEELKNNPKEMQPISIVNPAEERMALGGPLGPPGAQGAPGTLSLNEMRRPGTAGARDQFEKDNQFGASGRDRFGFTDTYQRRPLTSGTGKMDRSVHLDRVGEAREEHEYDGEYDNDFNRDRYDRDRYNRTPGADSRFDRSPIKDDRYDRSSMRDDRSSMRDDRYDRSPMRDDRYDRSPMRDDRYDRTPMRDDRYDRTPDRGFGRSQDKDYDRDRSDYRNRDNYDKDYSRGRQSESRSGYDRSPNDRGYDRSRNDRGYDSRSYGGREFDDRSYQDRQRNRDDNYDRDYSRPQRQSYDKDYDRGYR